MTELDDLYEAARTETFAGIDELRRRGEDERADRVLASWERLVVAYTELDL